MNNKIKWIIDKYFFFFFLRPSINGIYRHINKASYTEPPSGLFYKFWYRHIPTKILLFGWLVWKDKVLTGSNLMKRGFFGLFRCHICLKDYESTEHLFFKCPVILKIWRLFSVHFFGNTWCSIDFMNAVLAWDNLKGRFKSLPFFLIWEVWFGRNRMIFENIPFQIPNIYSTIAKWLDERTITVSPIQDLSVRLRPHAVNLPAVYFDGACMNGNMGCGTWIKISQRERVHIHFNAGKGSNNKAEVIALWGGLRFMVIPG